MLLGLKIHMNLGDTNRQKKLGRKHDPTRKGAREISRTFIYDKGRPQGTSGKNLELDKSTSFTQKFFQQNGH